MLYGRQGVIYGEGVIWQKTHCSDVEPHETPKGRIYKAPKSLIREHPYRIRAMVLETHGEEFHVALWRMGEEKLGLKLAVADNTLRIHAITGSRIEEMNQRCRTCRVKQILEQQLLERDQVVSVNGKSGLSQMVAELSNVKAECCHVRVRRQPQEAVFVNQRSAVAAFTKPAQNLSRSVSLYLQTIDEPGYRGLPMQTPNGILAPASLPLSATSDGALHMRSAGFSETASVLSVQGTENLAATTQADATAVVARAARPLPQMPKGTGPPPELVLPRVPAVPAGLSAEEQHHRPASAIGASASGIAVASVPKGLLQVQVFMNYDPRSEPEYGYLGVAEGTMVTVQLGSRSAPEARNWFQCDYVFAWKADQNESQGWLPVDILDNKLGPRQFPRVDSKY